MYRIYLWEATPAYLRIASNMMSSYQSTNTSGPPHTSILSPNNTTVQISATTIINSTIQSVNSTLQTGTVPISCNSWLDQGTLDWITVYIASVSALSIIGAAGNILTLKLLSLEGYFESPLYIYIRALATADLIGLIILLLEVIPTSYLLNCSTWSNHCVWRFYERFIYLTLGDIPLKVTTWFSCVLVIERAIVVRYPSRTSAFKKHPIRFVSGIIFCAFIETIPTFMNWYIDSDCEMHRGSWHGSREQKIWQWVDSVLSQYLPLAIMLPTSILLCAQLHRLRHSHHTFSHPAHCRASLMLIGPALITCLTMVPATVLLRLRGNPFEDMTFNQSLITWSAILLCLNHSTSFLFYCAISPHYWRCVHKLFKCDSQVSPSDDTPTPHHLTESRNIQAQHTNRFVPRHSSVVA